MKIVITKFGDLKVGDLVAVCDLSGSSEYSVENTRLWLRDSMTVIPVTGIDRLNEDVVLYSGEKGEDYEEFIHSSEGNQILVVTL
jgi:hypothetical protein